MVPQKLPKKKLWRSALYYRNNPEARAKKAATDKAINARPEQRAKRSELSIKRKKLKAKWINVKGKDIAHTKNGTRLKSIKANRGSKWDTAGDKRARW